MENERIIDRVRKMLALAADSAATEGERDNALRMAHNLLAKYNLELSDITEAEDPRGLDRDEGWSMTWVRFAYSAVGELFFCSYFYGQKVNATKQFHNFVGKKSNTVTAHLMAQYVVTSILKEARSLYKHNLSPESRSFAMGAVGRLQERVYQLRKGSGQEIGTGIVLQDYYKTEASANQAFMDKAIRTKTTAVRTKHVEASAYNAGQAFGNTISLNNQVSSSKKGVKLLT